MVLQVILIVVLVIGVLVWYIVRRERKRSREFLSQTLVSARVVSKQTAETKKCFIFPCKAPTTTFELVFKSGTRDTRTVTDRSPVYQIFLTKAQEKA